MIYHLVLTLLTLDKGIENIIDQRFYFRSFLKVSG